MKSIAKMFLVGLIFSSCAPSTPEARISQNPGKFAALGSKDQSLVRQGQIRAGMSPEAVTLAWGFPDRRFEGSQNARQTERWDYTSLRPIYSTNYFGGLNYGYGGYGPYGRRGYSGMGFSVGPELDYIPERVASVWFVNRRVESWERVH